jgi:integrase
LGWGVTAERHGRPYLDRNRLAGWHLPREQDIRRPLIADETIRALLAVAPRVHPRLTLLILLLETTGRRLSSVLGLRWDDLDFAQGVIRWRGELDKKRRTQEAPMPTRAARALLAERRTQPAIGGALLFPSRRNPAVRVSRHLAADWLKRAYRYAGLSRPLGGLWHPFRRKWATERKHHPVRDLAEAGGWKDVQTLLTCYVQADLDTMRDVVEHPRPRRKPSPEMAQVLAHRQQMRPRGDR